MKNIFKLITLFLAMVTVFSCTEDSKDDLLSDAKTYVSNKVTTESEGYLKLISFNKTDGIEREIFGVKNYEMTCTAEIECTKDGRFINIMRNGNLGSLRLNQKLDSYLSNFMRPAKNGDRYNKVVKLFFEKHENGWVIKNWQQQPFQ